MVQIVDDLGTGFEKNVQNYEESITRNTAKLNAMIEPLMMVFLAGMVLVFLLALHLPLGAVVDQASPGQRALVRRAAQRRVRARRHLGVERRCRT